MPELSITVETPDGQVFDSFTAAAEAGHPFNCEAFARCENAADTAISHPILDAVPACRRCADKLAALA